MKRKGKAKQRKRKGRVCFFCFEINHERKLRGNANDHHHPPKCCVYPKRWRILIDAHWNCHLKYNEIFKSILAKGYTPEETVMLIEIPDFLEKGYKERLLANLPEKEVSPVELFDFDNREISPGYYQSVKGQIIKYKLFMRAKKMPLLVCT